MSNPSLKIVSGDEAIKALKVAKIIEALASITDTNQMMTGVALYIANASAQVLDEDFEVAMHSFVNVTRQNRARYRKSMFEAAAAPPSNGNGVPAS